MIRVIVADDHAIVRSGLVSILGEADDIEIVAEAASHTSLLQLLRQHSIDVLLLDVSMPNGNFLDILSKIRRDFPDVGILVLSVHPVARYAGRAIETGALGYLTKDRSPEELIPAVHAAVRGEKFITNSVAIQLANELEALHNLTSRKQLSNREFSVLCLLAQGSSPAEIAGKLNINANTVRTYQLRILRKLGLKSRTELIRYAIEHNLID